MTMLLLLLLLLFQKGCVVVYRAEEYEQYTYISTRERYQNGTIGEYTRKSLNVLVLDWLIKLM